MLRLPRFDGQEVKAKGSCWGWRELTDKTIVRSADD
jgi:hypothetical protein